MSEILKEIKKLRKEVKEVKNILTDETSRKYVQALIDNVKEEELSKEYLEHWTCDHCGEHTHEVDYDYLSNGTNHLGCELKLEMGEKN
jgi:transcriptional regulator of met regulon